jgi:cyclopropane fatty-acyl-phospholipid synthase-like methyltransferase
MIQTCQEEIIRKNREIYSETSSMVWQVAVYGGLHGGWEFLNLGGSRALEIIAQSTGGIKGKRVLELCAGQAAPARYLAHKYGCRVTAVEMNPGQVANARARVAELDEETAALVEIVEADVLSYQPSDAFEVVFSMDSAMLIPDLPRLLEVSSRALRAGGRMELITIGAGPFMDEKTRAFAWDIDGMLSLLTMGEWVRLFEEAGFSAIRAEDITALAIENSKKLDAALLENREEIERAEGRETFLGWMNVGAAYLAAFSRGSLSYLHVSASAPGIM